MRRFLTLLFPLFLASAALAQPKQEANVLLPRANMVAYEDENAIEKLAYRDSPYYLELSGSWKQRRTDSSILYSRQIDVEKTWKDYLVHLNVRCGRACRVMLDNVVVGYADDSRNWNEFHLSPFLRYGKTMTLTIEALRQSQGALLEDTALRFGLNGEPFILFKSDPGIADIVLDAAYDPMAQTGTLTVDATVINSSRKGKYYLEVEILDPKGHTLDRMGRWLVFDKRSENQADLSRSWAGVSPWSAESPSLYTAIVRLRDEKMNVEEVVGSRFGFRTVAIDGAQLLVNGKPVVLKGVTYGLNHTEGYASRERMRQDVVTMKRNNINAVRTARFSPMDPFFYELCDQYGLYVVCDANLLPASTQSYVVATDQNMVPLFERRVENMVGRLRNHSSIILWSLGNTPDNGLCMTAAYKRLKALDKTRPVIFAGADYGESTDIIGLKLPSHKSLRQTLAKSSNRPILLFAAVNADNFPELEHLWNLVGSQPSLQGGFVDIWPLSHMMQSELNHLFRPFDVRLVNRTPDEGEFLVTNRNHFTSLADYRLDYVIYTNRRSNIVAGDLPTGVPGGQSEKVSIRLPKLDLGAGEESYVRFNLTRKNLQRSMSHSDLNAGSVVFPLASHQQAPVPFRNGEDTLPTSDSLIRMMPLQLLFMGHSDWTVDTIDVIRRRPDPHSYCVDAMLRYASPDGRVMCDVRSTATLYASGDILVDYTLAPTDNHRGALAPAVRLTHAFDSIQWFGLDREVLFSTDNSGIVGSWRAALHDPLSRSDVRWCAPFRADSGLFVRFIGRQATFQTSGADLTMQPQAVDNTFSLHLRPYAGVDPSDFLTISFPKTSSGILAPPSILADAARFSKPLTVTITAAPGAQIRYTLDGTEPTDASPIYTKPFVIDATTIVKARAFLKDTPPSFTSTHRFSYDHIVATTFSRPPSNPYNVGTDTLLFDGEHASIDDLNRGWAGFSGGPVTVTVQLSKPILVDQLHIRFAHAPNAWAFAPTHVIVSFSADGVNYSAPRQVEMPFDPALQDNAEARVADLVIPVDEQGVAYVRIEALPMTQIPAWHRGKGLKPWLLIDELEVREKKNN
mgnify:CR=1 FL=1